MYEYEINENTLFLLPMDENRTMVYEKERSFLVLNKAIKIISDSALFYGSSLDGRKISSSKMLGSSYKVPIVISENDEIIVFPTSSYRYNLSTWICFNNVYGYHKDGNQTLVSFAGNKEYKINVSYNIFDNQFLRSVKLLLIYRNRKKKW